MKRMLFTTASLVMLIPTIAQVRNPRTTATTAPGTMTLSTTQQSVTLFDEPNFTGQSKSFPVGTYRFTSQADFNDVASSIRVPAGMVALIYEHANEKGGYGSYVDILEDVPDLSVYNFNNNASYLVVFSLTRTGYVYVRGRMNNNEFIAGHWERKRASGVLPDNSPPAVVSSLSETGSPNDYTGAPMATQQEIDEFNDVMNNQLGVGVLDGETTKPIYYHHNQPGEEVYKYNKVIDPARLPGGFFDWVGEKLGRAGIIVKPVEVLVDLAGDIKDWIFGSSSTKMEMDCWFPVSEFRQTMCGKMQEDAFICGQDYIHTQVTIDKDACFNITPSQRFTHMLTNRWTGETHTKVEGEIKSLHLSNFNTSTGKSTETTTPRNPMLLQIKKDENVCLYGPWMGDILDLNLKVPVPFTDEKLSLGNIDLRKNNEIHPINQMWRKSGKELQLIAVVDNTGYFAKKGGGEVQASGLGQRMRFHIAFLLPSVYTVNSTVREFNVDAIPFEITDHPNSNVQAETMTVKYKGGVRLKLNNYATVRVQKTHKVFFDRVRRRADGTLQGYIVIETEPIVKPGGSINMFVKDITPAGTSPVIRDRPIRRTN